MPITSLEQLPKRPSKQAQQLATHAYQRITDELATSSEELIDVALAKQGETLTLPREALLLLKDVLEAMAKGRPVSIVPLAMELTTQAAADHLGCSRPHLIKLLESGKIPFTKVGRHRRLRFEDLLSYKKGVSEQRERLLAEMMAEDGQAGLYNTEENGTQ